MKPRDYAPLGERQYADELPDDQPSRAAKWARRWIIAVCMASLVMGAVIVTNGATQ